MFQIALMLVTPPMIIIGNIWMLQNDEHNMRDLNEVETPIKRWIFIEYTVALNLLWL